MGKEYTEHTEYTPGQIGDFGGCADGQVSEWKGGTNAQLERLRQRAKLRAERAMGSGRDGLREEQNRWRGKAEDAWDRFEEAVRERKEEAERRYDAEQVIDVDPLHQGGNWNGAAHSSQR